MNNLLPWSILQLPHVHLPSLLPLPCFRWSTHNSEIQIITIKPLNVTVFFLSFYPGITTTPASSSSSSTSSTSAARVLVAAATLKNSIESKLINLSFKRSHAS